jgi:hypothetical protein
MLYFVDWCIINFVENLIELSIGGDDPINIIPLKPLYKNNVWEGATYYDHEPGDLPIQEHQICLRG